MATPSKTTKITSSDIYSLYKEYHVPKHVIKHMLKVAKIAEKLCDNLTKADHKINKELVVKAALLHDLVRVADFSKLDLKRFKQEMRSKDIEKWIELREKHGLEGHVKAGAKILKDLGHNRIANLIAKHGIFSVDELKSWEEKVLYYADKRVVGSRKVRLKTRLRKIWKKHPASKSLGPKIIALEKELKAATKKKVI
jgi:putative nucleotidyltransferase with HDIG domain